MDAIPADVWAQILEPLSNSAVCSLSACSKACWQVSSYKRTLELELVVDKQLHSRLVSLLCFLTSRRKHLQVTCLELHIQCVDICSGLFVPGNFPRYKETAMVILACIVVACRARLEALDLRLNWWCCSDRCAQDLLSAVVLCRQLQSLRIMVQRAVGSRREESGSPSWTAVAEDARHQVDFSDPWALVAAKRHPSQWVGAAFAARGDIHGRCFAAESLELACLRELDIEGMRITYTTSLPHRLERAAFRNTSITAAMWLDKCRGLQVLHLQSQMGARSSKSARKMLRCLEQSAALRVLSLTRGMQVAWGSRGYPGCDSDGVGVLNESLQRIKPLTHLALLVHAAHAEPSQRDGDKDVGSSLPAYQGYYLSPQRIRVLAHATLEVLVLTRCWVEVLDNYCGLKLRCGRLHTLVLVLEDLEEAPNGWGLGAAYHKYKDLIAGLSALASGTPALRALHLVLPIDVARGDLGPLWRALGALPNLASLALGCVFEAGEPTAHMGKRIAGVLDAAQAHLPSVTDVCVHAGYDELKLGKIWQNQAGARGIINAVGRLVQRGVLPSLRRLSVGGVDFQAWGWKEVPRPDAAPHVETVLLPGGRRPPGQLFWVTDDVLPDLHVALGVREGHDWSGRNDRAD